MMKRQIENFRRQLWLRRVCYGLMFFAAVAIFLLMSFRPEQVRPPDPSELSLPTSTTPWPTGKEQTTTSSGTFQIEDIISFGSEVLFLLREPPNLKVLNKETLKCRYGTALHKPLALHLLHHNLNLAAVVCPASPESIPSVLIENPSQEIRAPKGKSVLAWNATKVVYEAFATEQDVVLFVHGFNQTLGFTLTEFECVFGDGEVATSVSAQTSEVFRCDHPPVERIATFAGTKISLRYSGKILPSVAYYIPREDPSKEEAQKEHHVCACTMIFNGAKFLREWVFYHSHLGVEKFIFYDNNSDDNLEDVIAGLTGFNVTKHSWPWVKTQEAAFSHCSLLAKPECTWMLFTDIDEYFFPSERFLSQSLNESVNADTNSPGYKRSTPSILTSFIADSLVSRSGNKEPGTVGQISTYCRNFGPSGLAISPPEGVTQGYTCRVQKQKRHKSIVMLSAIDDSLGNQVHHFSLKPPYVQVQIRPWVAIINHYRFQVWDEFKTKFHRRAATYVADWTEDRNHGSNDRVPGLGTKPVKPRDWERRYCEVRDTGLRNYTRRIFGSEGQGKLHLAWE